jgi:hypothetical protein
VTIPPWTPRNIDRAIGRQVLRAAAVLALASAVDAAPAPAAADNYLPLVIGNRWTYTLTGGTTEVVVVDRTTTIRGRDVFVLTHTVEDTPVEEDFWSSTDGDVFYHGYYRTIEDFGILCDPPVKLVDAPLLSGSVWSTTSELFILPDSLSTGTSIFSFAVTGVEDLKVPAGTFTTTAIEPLAAIHLGAASPGGTIDFPSRWVTNGIGTIRSGGTVPRDLASYSVVLAVLPSTWGAIKWQLGR